jgi:hypothetical protein
MGAKQSASFPEGLVIGDGYQLVWDAVDPNTGASVAGVVVTNVNVSAADVSGSPAGGDTQGPFMLVPGPGA